MRAAVVSHCCLYTRVAYLRGVTATLQDYRLQETKRVGDNGTPYRQGQPGDDVVRHR